MISPVSMANVQFTAQPVSNESVLSRKGAYTRDIAPEINSPKKKKNGFKKFLIATLVAAATLVTLNKTNVLKVIPKENLADAKFLQKAGHYLAQAGEFIGKYTVDLAVNGFNKLFKKAPKVTS